MWVVTVPGFLGAKGRYRNKVALERRLVSILVLTAMNAVAAGTLGKVPWLLPHFFK